MKKKIENDAAALMRSVVAKRGRNVELAESAVRESKSFTEQEALDKKLIEYVAPSEQDLFHQMNGKSFKRFDGTTVTLSLDRPKTNSRLPDDAQAAHPLLHHGSQHQHSSFWPSARLRCTWNSIIPGQSFPAPSAWSSFFRRLRHEPAARALRRDRHDHRSLRCSSPPKPNSPATECSPPAGSSF